MWGSFRLPKATMDQLAEMVANGVPPNSSKLRNVCSVPTRMRFNRLARACFARAIRLRKPFRVHVDCGGENHVDARYWGRLQGAARRALVFEIEEEDGKVRAKPMRSDRCADTWREIAPRVQPGVPHYVGARQAYVWLAVRGERVVIPKECRPRQRFERPVTPHCTHVLPSGVRPKKLLDPMDTIYRFCRYLAERLELFHSVPLADFHLYLYEACARFNFRRRKLERKLMVMKMMSRYSLHEIEGRLSS